MIASKTKVASNTSWFTAALVLQKIISFVYFTYLARILGAEDLGKYVFALSYVAMFSIILDFGLSNLITREVAKDQTISQKIYSNVLGFKVVSFLIASVLAITALELLGYPFSVKQLVYLALFLMVIESLVLSSYAVLRGHHNLKFESIGTILVQLIIAILGVVALQFTRQVVWLIVVMVGANFIHLIYVWLLLKFNLQIRIKISFDLKFVIPLLKLALPFALAAGFTKVYGAFDQVLLSKLAGSEALGFYAVAYKLTFALQFVPLALVAALYPAMSTYYVSDRQMLSKALTKAVYFLLLITIPLSAGVVVLARDFISSLYTDAFLPAVLPLQILILSITFLFINFPLGSLLNATDRQGVNTLNIGLALLLNIILNIILTPKYGAVGAAIASLSSTVFLFVIGWYAVSRVVAVDCKYLFIVTVKTLLSAGIMVLVIIMLKQYLYWLAAAVIGAIVYWWVQFIFGAIKRADFIQLVNSFKRR